MKGIKKVLHLAKEHLTFILIDLPVFQYIRPCFIGLFTSRHKFIIHTHAEVSGLPVHPDCAPVDQQRKDIAIIYPRPGSKIYVPYEWDKQKSKAVFSAVHRSDTASVYWHLDKQYIGKTREFHQLEIDPKPGMHVLTLQDEMGAMVTTVFEVLAR